MSLFKVRHYVVYRNEVLFVNPAEWPDGKWRRRRPSKVEISFTRPAEVAYQAPEEARVRFAARRIRCVGFDSCVDDESVMRYIRTAERIETRKRLHDAEREMREADGMLAGLGTITEDEATRRIGAVASWGSGED